MFQGKTKVLPCSKSQHVMRCMNSACVYLYKWKKTNKVVTLKLTEIKTPETVRNLDKRGKSFVFKQKKKQLQVWEEELSKHQLRRLLSELVLWQTDETQLPSLPSSLLGTSLSPRSFSSLSSQILSLLPRSLLLSA